MRTDLGHFPKSRDMRGVFPPCRRTQIAIVALAAVVLPAIAFIFSGAPESHRIASVNQEVVSR